MNCGKWGFKLNYYKSSYGLLVYLMFSLTIQPVQANEKVPELILTEKQAVEIAVRDNPNLAQMKERYKAMGEVPSQVGSLPDPTISLNAMNFPTEHSTEAKSR